MFSEHQLFWKTIILKHFYACLKVSTFVTYSTAYFLEGTIYNFKEIRAVTRPDLSAMFLITAIVLHLNSDKCFIFSAMSQTVWSDDEAGRSACRQGLHHSRGTKVTLFLILVNCIAVRFVDFSTEASTCIIYSVCHTTQLLGFFFQEGRWKYLWLLLLPT